MLIVTKIGKNHIIQLKIITYLTGFRYQVNKDLYPIVTVSTL